MTSFCSVRTINVSRCKELDSRVPVDSKKNTFFESSSAKFLCTTHMFLIVERAVCLLH